MNINLSEYPVLHHTVLKNQGGTAMIAGILCRELRAEGRKSALKSEMEGTDPEDDFPGFNPESGCIRHLHGASSWPGLLQQFTDHNQKIIITLHDASLLTGGCVYPLECTEWISGCPDCPRGYVRSQVCHELNSEHIQRLNPVLVAPSRWMAAMAEKRFPGRKVAVIANGIDREPALAGRRPKIPGFQGKLVLFAAHGGVQAGYKSGRDWSRIWNMIADRAPGARALFVGNESAENREDVFHLPYVPNSVLRELMKRADLLVYPSRADNHPLVILEAMMSSLAVAAFAVGGIPEQIEPGKSGVLAGDCSWKVLAEEAANLLNHPRKLRLLGRNAQYSAQKKFTAERMFSDYRKVYAAMG